MSEVSLSAAFDMGYAQALIGGGRFEDRVNPFVWPRIVPREAGTYVDERGGKWMLFHNRAWITPERTVIPVGPSQDRMLRNAVPGTTLTRIPEATV